MLFWGSKTWSADGRFVFVKGMDDVKTMRTGLFRVSTDTGEVETILAPESGIFPKQDTNKTYTVLIGWSPDASIVYKAINYRDENGQRGPMSIVEHRVADRAERELFRSSRPAEAANRFAVSPDGKWLAFGVNESVPPTKRTLLVMPSEGGAPKTVQEFDPEGWGVWGIDWSVDGRSLTYLDNGWRYGRDQGPAEWWHFDLATGTVKKLTPPEKLVYYLTVSPTGREIAYTVQWRETDHSVWLMENFLPPTQGKATPPKK
jgi:Tol biopolymer transport system component